MIRSPYRFHFDTNTLLLPNKRSLRRAGPGGEIVVDGVDFARTEKSEAAERHAAHQPEVAPAGRASGAHQRAELLTAVGADHSEIGRAARPLARLAVR